MRDTTEWQCRFIDSYAAQLESTAHLNDLGRIPLKQRTVNSCGLYYTYVHSACKYGQKDIIFHEIKIPL